LDEAGSQACAPVHYGGREEDPPVALHRAGHALVVKVESVFGHARGTWRKYRTQLAARELV